MGSPAVKLKNILRSRMRKKIERLSLIQQRDKSRSIFKRVIKSDFYRQAESLLIYVSFKKEAATKHLILKSLKDGKRVFVPCIQGRAMQACRIRNFSKDLKKGIYGILEPRSSGGKKTKFPNLDVIFVPGLAFDKAGGRLGRGAGYFDRYLAKHKITVKIGLAYKEQIVKKVPVEKHDVRLDFIITD